MITQQTIDNARGMVVEPGEAIYQDANGRLWVGFTHRAAALHRWGYGLPIAPNNTTRIRRATEVLRDAQGREG